jgi:mRNA-degrading endonuclease toxin of MazEF toxin-antitoxin module
MADTVVVLPSQYVAPLSAEETRQSGFTHRITIPYTVIAAVTGGTTGDTVTVTCGSTPTKFLVDKVAALVTTAFVTTNTGTLTASVGISTSTAVFMAAKDMLTAAAYQTAAGAVPAGTTSTTGVAAVTLAVRFTTGTAGAPSAVSAGSVDIFLGMRDLAKIDSINGNS